MAHNSLRRAIAEHMAVLYGTPDEQVLVAYRLLERALVALGGPVAAQVVPPVSMAEGRRRAYLTGTPGCPPVDAVSSSEGGTECNPHAFEDIARENREAIELINRQQHPERAGAQVAHVTRGV